MEGVRNITKDDIGTIEAILKDCGDAVVAREYPFVRRAFYFGSWAGEIIGDSAFYLCRNGAKTIRLYFLAVKAGMHGNGLGRTLLNRLWDYAVRSGHERITFRTAMLGDALGFWLRHGAEIVGQKDNDFEMQIRCARK